MIFEDELGLKGQVKTLQEYPITNHIKWAYQRTHSNVLAAREGTPHVALKEGLSLDDWSNLWGNIDRLYRDYLEKQGYSDRVYAIVGANGRN